MEWTTFWAVLAQSGIAAVSLPVFALPVALALGIVRAFWGASERRTSNDRVVLVGEDNR